MEDELAPVVEAESTPKKKDSRQKPTKSNTIRWQERLLPTMAGMLIGLTLFFFIASLIQLAYLHTSILNYPPLSIDSERGEALIADGQNFNERFQARKLELLSGMEAYIIERRYHQASVALMSAIWIRYLGFVTGMILALVGASFVLGKITTSASDISGKTSVLDFSLRSTSPGIILVTLGVILMFATIMDKDKFDVNDSPAYLINTVEQTGINLQEPEARPTFAIPEQFLYPEDTPTPTAP